MILNALKRTAAAINPIELFNSQQFGKAMRSKYPISSLAKTFDENMVAMRQRATHGAANILDYFGGYNVGEVKAQVPDALRGFRRDVRRGAGIAAGTYFGANMLLGGDNPLSRAIGFTTQVGVHTAIGAGLYKAHPLAGIAYGGVAGFNLLRRGDNLGPM